MRLLQLCVDTFSKFVALHACLKFDPPLPKNPRFVLYAAMNFFHKFDASLCTLVIKQLRGRLHYRPECQIISRLSSTE
jgi:hypothetical protein